MIKHGPEFLSVIEGATGKELARTGFIPRGQAGEFGDSAANRSDRFLGGAGYFDGIHPGILICRGYYAKTVVEVWDFHNGELTKRWSFNTTANNQKYKTYEGQGNHNLSIGDTDGDGKDEITYGACLIDHDGSGGYNTLLGHGDALHLTDIDIDRPGLEVWDCHEHAPSRAGSELRDACTGQLLWGIPSVEDVGRALAADIDPRFRGCEVWTNLSGGVYTADGRLISERTPSINMALWWDGDLNRELLDGSGVTKKEFIAVTKWNGDGVDKLMLPDEEELAANNWTKGTPCLQADILGDWREEIITRTRNNKEVRILITPYETQYRFYTLMSDIIYRMSVLTQNSGYNQCTQTGFYLGSDLGKFWPGHYISPFYNSKSGTSSDNRPNGMNARLKDATLVIEKDISTSKKNYCFDAGYTYDSYLWTLDGKRINGNRQLSVSAEDFGLDHKIKLNLKTSLHGCLFEDDASVVFTSK
jgi:rhamnogalacturonan endolyase